MSNTNKLFFISYQNKYFIQLQIDNSLLIMSSEEYYGYRQPRLSIRPQIKRTQLSSQKLIISRSKQKEKQRQLEAQQQKLQKLKRKYHQISIDNKQEVKLKSKKNKHLKSNRNFYLNDLRFRLNHYDDQGAIGYNQIVKEKVEKRALQFLQKNFKTKSELVPSNGGMVNQKAIQQTQQIIQTRLLNRSSRKKYDGYSSRIGRGQMRSCSTNSQRFLEKRRYENSIQKSDRSLNNDNQDYNLRPRSKKNIEINQKQSMILGTQTIRKPYEEQKNQKSTIKAQKQKQKDEQQNESEISVNSRHDNSRLTKQLQNEYDGINKQKEREKKEQKNEQQGKKSKNKLLGSGLIHNRESYESESDNSYVNNSINSNIDRNNYNILATSDYERIKELEKRARDQSFLRSSKSMTHVNGNEDMKNGEYNKLLQEQSSSLDVKYQEQKTKKVGKSKISNEISANPSSKSNSNTISNLIKNSSELIKNGVGEQGQSSDLKYNRTENKKYVNNIYSALSASNSNSKMGQNQKNGLEMNKQTSVTNVNTNINVENGNMIKNASNNITFHNIINSNSNSNNSSNFNLHLNSNHNSNRNSENISSNTITNILLGRNSNSSKSGENKSLGLSSDCENFEDIFMKGTKQIEQKPMHASNLNNLNTNHSSIQNMDNCNEPHFILSEQKVYNIFDSINETDILSSQSYIKSKKMVRIPLYYAAPDQSSSRLGENRSGSLSMSNTNSMVREDKRQTEIQFQFQYSNQAYSLMHNKASNNSDMNSHNNVRRVSLLNDGNVENNRWDNSISHSVNNRLSSNGTEQYIENNNNSFNKNYQQNIQYQQYQQYQQYPDHDHDHDHDNNNFNTNTNCQQSPIFSFSHKQVPRNEPFALSDLLKEWNSQEQQQIIYLYTSFGQECPQLQTLMDKYYEHITIVNKIADFLSETQQFYLDPQQRQTFHLSMFLLFKFFYQSRQLILQSLTQGRSCFILTNKEISEWEVHKYFQQNCVRQLCQCLFEGNRKLQNILLRFQSYLKERLPDNMINFQQIRKQDLNIITQKLNEELEMLVTKIQEIIEQKSNSLIKDNQYEVISLRAFAIMQLLFLISELRGRKVKGFEHVIEPEDFEMYCKKYYGSFKETILYFH